MLRIFITGANRGIGLGLVRRYLERPDTRIFAACRKPSEAAALNALVPAYTDRLSVLQLDVADQASINAAAQILEAHIDGLDILYNNAAINPPGVQSLEKIDVDTLMHILRVNTAGPLLVARACLTLLRGGVGPRIVNLSSGVGSLAGTNSGGMYGYRTSKAGVNMMTRMLAADLAGQGIIVVSLDPGWVKTDMGGPGAKLEPEESTQRIVQVVDGLTLEHSGSFLRWDGGTVDW